MAMTRVTENLYRLALGIANAYLIVTPQSLVLVDTGFPDKADAVLQAVQDLGRKPEDLRDIILTHAHFDHIGSLAALVRTTRATTWMHVLDIPFAERGSGFRPMQAAPGLLRRGLFRIFSRPGQVVQPTNIDRVIEDGDVLPVAGGLHANHGPGTA